MLRTPDQQDLPLRGVDLDFDRALFTFNDFQHVSLGWLSM
jgi:hypothetical protein